MSFCKVPIDGRLFGVTIKLSRWRGPDKWQDLSCHDKIVKVACKNHDNCASDCRPIDFVSAVGLVKVPKVK